MKYLGIGFPIISAISIVSTFSLLHTPRANAQAPQPVKPPAIQAPKIVAPTVTAPTAAAPATLTPKPVSAAATTATAGGAAVATARAALVATAYDETAYTTAANSGVPVVLIFSSSTDPIWATQAAALQTILREPEFAQGAKYQIDMASTDLAEKFAVRNAATILIMKDGVERLRSTRMTKPDAIRKMLRLKTAL